MDSLERSKRNRTFVHEDEHFGRVVTFTRVDGRASSRTLAQKAARHLGLGHNVRCVKVNSRTGAIFWRHARGKVFPLGFINRSVAQVYEKMPLP